ncbi:MAG TPA: hypothetical protein VFE62_26110 [Gemmataceae bacterium]|nr:hypothetical protein [Gemmataceae bacterium]
MLPQIRWLAVWVVIGAAPAWAAAEQVRYRFVPVDACGTMSQAPIGPQGTMGELRRVYGARALPYPYVVRPTQMVTFRHPFSGRNVTVPLRLPDSTPRMEHQTDRIIYNYNDYTVEARFQPDGSVDVIYNSGLLRPLPWN